MSSNSILEVSFFEPLTSTRGQPNQTTIAQGVVNKVLSTTAASSSIVGTLIIIATFVIWSDLRTNSRTIIVCISIGDLFVAISNIIGLYKENLCEIQATLNIAAVLSSFFWTVYLSLFFYVTICKKISTQWETRLMCFFQVTGWGIPLVLAAAAFGFKAAGNSDDLVSSGWCWIRIYKQHWWKTVLWMCLAGKGWEILAYIVISVFYVLVKLQIRREGLRAAVNEHVHEQLATHLVDMTRTVAKASRENQELRHLVASLASEVDYLKHNQEEVRGMLEIFLPGLTLTSDSGATPSYIG